MPPYLERVYLKAYGSVSAARADIAEYLDWYNTKRPHSSLADATPETAYLNTGGRNWRRLRKMQFPVRPALHNLVNNDAPLTRPTSTYKSGKAVQINEATSERYSICSIIVFF